MSRLPFHDIGYLVDDLEAAAADAVACFGAGPFYVAEHMEFEEVTFRGQPAVFDHSSAFGQWGRVRVGLEATCGPAYHTGRTGPVSAIWHDARATLGHSVELLQRNDFLIGLYARIAQSAEGWDGSDPLRAMSEIAQAG